MSKKLPHLYHSYGNISVTTSQFCGTKVKSSQGLSTKIKNQIAPFY